ncbi:hypothetical protein GCM10028821_34560 [Hymenobacter jeollabukensis]
MGVLWLAAAPAYAQTPPLDVLCDETFQHPPPDHYLLGQFQNNSLALGPEGYTMRFTAAQPTLVNQSTNPPGPALNQQTDFVLEAEVRGQGSIGFYWGGQSSAEGNEFNLLQLDLANAGSPGFSVWQLRRGSQWTKLTSGALPGPAAAPDWHALRVARRGDAVQYWLDGTQVWQQPWSPPPGRNVGLTVQNPGSLITLRRLRILHRYHLNLAPNLPAGLRRERLTAPGLNTEREESSPRVSADGRWLYFARVMGDNKAVDSSTGYNSDSYVTERQADGSWGPVRALGYPINNDVSNYPQAVSPDGQSLLLGGLYTPEGRGGGMGYSHSQRQADGSWTMPAALIPAADDSQQPAFGVRNQSGALDASGTVLVHSAVLASDLNNTELYLRRRLLDGHWSPSVPLPASINTAGNETTPFLAPDGKTLYFSSDTHPGYGSFDVFVSRRLDDSWARWSEPLNLGPAVNSALSEIDFSTTATGDFAYFASVDNLTMLGDIYRMALPTALRPTATVLVRGRVLDARTGQPVPGAQLRYEQLPDGRQAGEVPATAAGTFEIALPAGLQYGFRAEATGYLTASDNLDLGATATGEVSRDLYLLPVLPEVAPLAAAPVAVAAASVGTPAKVAPLTPPRPTAARLVLNNVFFEQGKPVLLPASFPELKRLAQTLRDNPTLRIRLEGHTDNQGDAAKNQLLSELRVAEIKKYLIRQQVAADRLETVGYGPTRPIAANDVEANRRRNRRVEFAILQR